MYKVLSPPWPREGIILTKREKQKIPFEPILGAISGINSAPLSFWMTIAFLLFNLAVLNDLIVLLEVRSFYLEYEVRAFFRLMYAYAFYQMSIHMVVCNSVIHLFLDCSFMYVGY